MTGSGTVNELGQGLKGWLTANHLALTTPPILGVVMLLVYGCGVPHHAATIGLSLLFAAAAAATGGLLGFLFGIPKALASDGATPTGKIRFVGNTNLEQVSDWLTKLLLGAGLVELGNLTHVLGRLFRTMAGSIGDGKGSGALPGALCVYFAIYGFVAAWLLTRLLLARMLVISDRAQALADKAQQAEDAGDGALADHYRAQAVSLLAAPVTAAYSELRSSMAPGADRTMAMDAQIAQMRELSAIAPPSAASVAQLFSQDSADSRIQALAMMQATPATADFDSIMSAVTAPRSANEQYQALIALAGLQLSPEQAERVKLALPALGFDPGSSRLTVARSVLDSLPANSVPPTTGQ